MNWNDGKTLQITCRWLTLAVVALAITFPIVYMVIALLRMGYPYELEWMEGGMLDQVRRILTDGNLYVEPSLVFTPFTYTPLYFYISAGAASLLNMVEFFPLRVISFIASMVSMVLIFFMVKRESQSPLAGLISAGLFAATYAIGGAWFDLGRPDSLLLMLLMAGIYFLRFGRTMGSMCVSGLLFGAAFMCSQTAFFAMIPLTLYCVLSERPWAKIACPCVFAAFVLLSTTVLQATTGGWYTFYIFDIPRHHGVHAQSFLTFWVLDLAKPLAPALLLTAAYLYEKVSTRDRERVVFYSCFLAAMVGTAWSGRVRTGSDPNTLIPAFAALAITSGLGIHLFMPNTSPEAETPDRVSPIGLAVIALALVQFLGLIYNPGPLLPSAGDRQAGDRLVALIAGIDGEVFAPSHGYLSALAGKQTSAHRVALNDICAAGRMEVRDEMHAEIGEAIRSGRFSALLLDMPSFFDELVTFYGYEGPAITETYELSGQALDSSYVFWPVTGRRTRPEFIFTRKRGE